MRNFRYVMLATALLVGLSSCNTARVNGTVKGLKKGDAVEMKIISGASLSLLDSVKVADGGAFSYDFKVRKGEPEFLYVYYGDAKIASLLLSSGDKVTVDADTLGSWTVSGSEDCAALRENELALAPLSSVTEISGRKYVECYRQMLSYVMSNSKSLTVVPVLLSKVGGVSLFAQPSDAVIFSSVADSLETVYPKSRYIKLLRTESDVRNNLKLLNEKFNGAKVSDYPELSLNDVNGQKRVLSECAAKTTVLVFWDATSPENKLFNQDVLKPFYEKNKGDDFQIYSVNLGPDKTTWAMVVREQNLPWINVCDTHGTSMLNYGVEVLPTVFIIRDGNVRKVNSVSELYGN